MATKNEFHVSKFGGENFASWKLRFVSKMTILDSKYKTLFKGFEKLDSTREITDNDFLKEDGSNNEEMIDLSERLKVHILLNTEDAMDIVLRAESTNHGLELWRRLCNRYDHVATMNSTGRLRKILQWKFDLENLEQNLAEWEYEVTKYELEEGALQEGVKVATVIDGLEGDIQQWAQLNCSYLKTYRALRDNLVSFARSRRFSSKSSPTPTPPATSTGESTTGPVPMDIGAVWQGDSKGYWKGDSKGKGTHKGKGKGKGKGAGKGPPQPPPAPWPTAPSGDSRQCYHCWGYGHISRDCPWIYEQWIDEWGRKWTVDVNMVGSSGEEHATPPGMPPRDSSTNINTVNTNMTPRGTRTQESRPPQVYSFGGIGSSHEGDRPPRVYSFNSIFAKDRLDDQAGHETMEKMVHKLVAEVTNLRIEIKRHEDSMDARVSHMIDQIDRVKNETETLHYKLDEMTGRVEDLTNEVEGETKILEQKIDELISKDFEMDTRETHEEFLHKMEENFERITKRIDLWSKEFVINHKLVDLEMQAFETKLQQNFEDHKLNSDEETETDSIDEIEEAIGSDDSSLDVKKMIKLEMDHMVKDLDGDEVRADREYRDDVLDGTK